MENIVLFIISVSLICASSVSWKISFAQVLKSFDGSSLLLRQFTNLWYIAGWIFYILATFLWVYLLGKYEYSKIYPIFVGVCIILSLIAGLVFFKENTGMLYKTTGAALIICGAILIAKS
jgi:multidrug transporter EmrE-like cation transporter